MNFFAEFHVRDHPVSLQSNPRHSSNSTRQKVLEYRRRRQSIQSGSMTFASKHDELSADKKSRAIQAGLPQGLLARTSSKTARNCKKQSVWASSVSAWHLDAVLALPLKIRFHFSLFFVLLPPIAKLCS